MEFLFLLFKINMIENIFEFLNFFLFLMLQKCKKYFHFNANHYQPLFEKRKKKCLFLIKTKRNAQNISCVYAAAEDKCETLDCSNLGELTKGFPQQDWNTIGRGFLLSSIFYFYSLDIRFTRNEQLNSRSLIIVLSLSFNSIFQRQFM